MLASDEQAIISRVLKGDQKAYALLVDKYQRFVFTIALRYLQQREDAEEAAQDVFIKAYRSLADFRGQSRFSTWLYTITTTTCLSILRRKKAVIHSLDDEKVTAAAEIQAQGMGMDLAEYKSRNAMVNRAIAMLGGDDAVVLTLFYKGEQSLDEIAAILGKESNAVKVQLHRARARLRDKLLKFYPHEINDLYN